MVNLPICEAEYMQAWDRFTIAQKPIHSIDLMELACRAFVTEFCLQVPVQLPVYIFCGPGNNGGDGFGIARLLKLKGYAVATFELPGARFSANCLANRNRWLALGNSVGLAVAENLLCVPKHAILIDALFGSGLNRPIVGDPAQIVDAINLLPMQKWAVDLPSGLRDWGLPEKGVAIKANYTLSFQSVKPCFLFPECMEYVGKWQVVDISLAPDFKDEQWPIGEFVVHPAAIASIINFNQFAHKGNRGHALIAAGSKPMMGAAILATKAATKSGAGLVSLATSETEWPIAQTAIPEAICTSPEVLSDQIWQQTRRVKAIALGPGWQEHSANANLLRIVALHNPNPLVLDATAIRLLSPLLKSPGFAFASNQVLLTPHIGEFDYLFGKQPNQAQRIQEARFQAQKLQVHILLKGAFTSLFSPNGAWLVNSTGNPGMAKGGSGDVLAGLLVGLLAQGYPIQQAAILGTWLHGMAGDLAAIDLGAQGMTATDLINYQVAAWKKYYRTN